LMSDVYSTPPSQITTPRRLAAYVRTRPSSPRPCNLFGAQMSVGFLNFLGRPEPVVYGSTT
ncbi:hypothetical protein J6590_061607, partial [Homalodisca vitripennis]